MHLPEMKEEELEEALLSLVQKGLIKVEYDEQLTGRFSFTPLGIAAVKAADEHLRG